MELDLVLDNQSLALVVDWLVKLGRDGVVGSLVLEDETLIAVDALEDDGLLDVPVADVLPFFLCVLLLRVRWLPSRVPVVGELLEEWCLKGGGLDRLAV